MTALLFLGMGVGCAARKDTAVVHLADPIEPAPSAAVEPEPPPEPSAAAPRPAPGFEDGEVHDGPDVDRARAKSLFEEGVQAYSNSDYPRACRLFQEAYDLVPERPLLFNIASCELRMGDTVSACGHFRRYVAEGDPADPRVQQVQGQVASRCRGIP